MLKARQYIGKYRIEKRLALGGFAAVYRAFDTIEGIRIALKVPHDEHITEYALRTFRNEERLAAKLDHPNTLMTISFLVTPDEAELCESFRGLYQSAARRHGLLKTCALRR